jgi:hypothetical protein
MPGSLATVAQTKRHQTSKKGDDSCLLDVGGMLGDLMVPLLQTQLAETCTARLSILGSGYLSGFMMWLSCQNRRRAAMSVLTSKPCAMITTNNWLTY